MRRRGRIAYEPAPWRAQGDPKIEEKKGRISEPLFLGKNAKNVKKILKSVSKRVPPKTWWRLLGQSWGMFGAPSHFSPPNMSP